MNFETYYHIQIHRSVKFFSALLDLFSNDALLSLEGEFRLDENELKGIHHTPTEILTRQTIAAFRGGKAIEVQFVIIPLTIENKKILKQKILPQIGIRKNVSHIQIEQEGRLVFSQFDGFGNGCGLATSIHSMAQLQTLQAQNIIKSFRLDTVNQNESH